MGRKTRGRLFAISLIEARIPNNGHPCRSSAKTYASQRKYFIAMAIAQWNSLLSIVRILEIDVARKRIILKHLQNH